MKKLIAIAAATAMLAATGSAFAADRLVDNQMDSVTAGFLNFNQTNNASVSNLQAVEVNNVAATIGGFAPDAKIKSRVSVGQNTIISQTNCRFTALTRC